jgi:hypothetical protein
MKSKTDNSERQKAERQQLQLLAFALFVLAVYVIVINIVALRGVTSIPLGLEVWFPEELPQEEVVSDAVGMTPSAPVRFYVPELNVDTTFERALDIDESTGEIEVPVSYEEIGWYKYGPTPGEVGPSVIVGHVDSHEGPAVFYTLGQLDIGDEMIVEREDGTEAVFLVEELERVRQDAFPTERVYGPISYAGVRVITCSGLYDRQADRYSHNLIVYGRLKTPQATTTNATIED